MQGKSMNPMTVQLPGHSGWLVVEEATLHPSQDTKIWLHLQGPGSFVLFSGTGVDQKRIRDMADGHQLTYPLADELYRDVRSQSCHQNVGEKHIVALDLMDAILWFSSSHAFSFRAVAPNWVSSGQRGAAR